VNRYCPFATYSEKREVQTTSHQKTSLKMAGVLPTQRTSHEVETAKAEETGKAIFCIQAGIIVIFVA